MELSGRVHNGVVVPEDPQALPEGAVVRIVIEETQLKPDASQGQRITLPLVPTNNPGSVHLTNDRIQEILLEEDIEALRRQWDGSA